MALRDFLDHLFSNKERFSERELRRLHGILRKNAKIEDSNREMVIEALRSIAETVIWYVESRLVVLIF